MGVIGNLVIGVGANTAKFVKGMKEASKELGTFAVKAAQAASKLSGINFASALPALAKFKAGLGGVLGSLTSLKSLVAGLGLAAGVATIGHAWTSVAMSASDLNEQISKAKTVFGDAVDVVSQGAQQMGNDFGYPKKEFYDAASSIGLIAKASGLSQGAAAQLGTDFAKLSADASSFYNVPLEEALGAIRSGLVGEAEPMRRFGVLLNAQAVEAQAAAQGFKKVNGAYTEGAKVQARATLIMKGLADAQGDLSRTASGVANMDRSLSGRLENLKAEAGLAIQPITDQFLLLANSAVKVLSNELDNNKAAIAEWAAGAGASGGVVTSAFAGVGQAIGFLADSIQILEGVWNGTQAVFTKGLQLVINAAYGLVKPFTFLLDLLPGFDGAFKRFEDAFNQEMHASAVANWEKAGDQLGGAKPSDKINEFFRKITEEAGKATQAMNAASAATQAIGKNADSSAPAVKDLTDKISTLEKDLQSQIEAFGKSGKESAIYKLELAGATKEQLANVRALSEQRDKLAAAKKAMDKNKADAKKITEDSRTPLQEYEEQIKKLKDLKAQGLIKDDTFKRASLLAKGELEKNGSPDHRYSAALTRGSEEARSTVLNYRGVDGAGGEPAKEAVTVAKKQLSIQEFMLKALQQMADSNAGAAAGEAAAAQLGAFDFA